MDDSMYDEWARAGARLWLMRLVEMEVARCCGGTRGSLARARFVESARLDGLADRLVNGVMDLIFGPDD